MLAAHMGSKKDMEKKGNLMFWWRSSMDEPFAKFRHVQIEGSPPVSGASPRWVRATNELFFTRIFPDKDEKSFNNIWVIRNFVPPIDVKGYRASGQ
jgi:hypothetical protein